MSIIRRWVSGNWEPITGLRTLTFSGGEPHVNITDRSAVAGFDTMIDVRDGGFSELGEALVVNDALRRSGAASVSLFQPYLPGARQDRGVPFTAKVYADIINAAEFDHVIAIDPHSYVMPALLERFEQIDAVDLVPEELLYSADGAPVVVICPDAGAAKRAEAVATRFGVDVAYARKRRDASNGRLDGFVCEPIDPDAVGVVVDDICDGGGTFIGLAEAVGHRRERLRLWTTHGIYTHGTAVLTPLYSLIAATDSFQSCARPGIVVPVGEIGAARLSELLGHTPRTATSQSAPSETSTATTATTTTSRSMR